MKKGGKIRVRSHSKIQKLRAFYISNHIYADVYQKGDSSERTTFKADFVLGCDGAFSSVRKAFMRQPWFDYNQVPILSIFIPACNGSKLGLKVSSPPETEEFRTRGREIESHQTICRCQLFL
jgi:hypothetical protein